MIIFYLLIGLLIFIFIKIILYIISFRYGKISYDGFNVAGFAYDAEKDIFYSTKDAWQKEFGYGHIYDVSAPIVRIIVDTEPIRFYYNNKNWLLVFWKGQYGITTGAEIGIYATRDKVVNKQTIYEPVSPDEMLDMRFNLYKKEEQIIEISSTHWWLAAFKLGMFSNPWELSMDVKLTFPNSEMLKAFLKAFKKMGYKEKHFEVKDNTFSFQYKKPHSRQVHTRTWLTDFFTQRKNKRNVKLYNQFVENIIETDGIDDSLSRNNKKLIILNDLIPDFLKGSISDLQLRSDKLFSYKNRKKIKQIANKKMNHNYLVCINIHQSSDKDEKGCHHRG